MSETGLTLWQIEETIAQLLELSDDADARHLAEKELPRIAEIEEEQKAIEAELTRYVGQELPAKVDGYVGLIRREEAIAEAAEKESIRLHKAYVHHTARVKRLKDLATHVMQATGKTRLDGSAGRALRLQGNGGAQPVVITEASLVPREYVMYVGQVPGFIWEPLISLARDVCSCNGNEEMLRDLDGLKLERVLQLKIIAADLNASCHGCDGSGKVPSPRPWVDEAENIMCVECDGTGKPKIPGAHLGERGQHLRIEP